MHALYTMDRPGHVVLNFKIHTHTKFSTTAVDLVLYYSCSTKFSIPIPRYYSTILYYTVYLLVARNNKIKYFQTLGVGTNERAARGHKSELKNEGLAKF